MNLLKTIVASLLMAGAACASPIFTLLPTGALTGVPGEALSIQFNLTSDNDYWISVIGVTTEQETNPSLGVFDDLTYTQGGPAGIILWVNGPSFTGVLGNYTIDSIAPVGATNTGAFWLLYETYTDDPLTCVDCLVGSDLAFADFTVDVVPAPEPATVALTAAALAVLVVRRKR